MSSHTKDPLEKQDTPTESGESHSDSEVSKAEENLEQLKIEERLTKDDSDESKPLDSPNQEGTSGSKYDLLKEPIAGSSGKDPRLESYGVSSDPESKVTSLTDPQNVKDVDAKDIDEHIGTKMVEGESNATSLKDVEAKSIDENIGARMVEGDSDTTSSTPPFIQSSTGVTPSSMLQEKSPITGPSRLRGNVDYSKLPINVVIGRFMRRSPLRSSSSRRFDYATDSANTSADVSEIRSEIADSSTEESVYHDVPESFEKDQSPSYASAVERQRSETSDTSISELQDDFIPPPTPDISSVSTPSGEQGHQAYLAQLQREADARGVPISTSSGIGSTNRSEIAHLEAWNTAGEIGFYRYNVDDPNQDVPDNVAHGVETQPTSESMEDDPILRDQQMQVFDRLFEQEHRNEENREEPNVPENAMSGCVVRRIQVEKSVQDGSVGAGSPSKRRRPSKCLSDSSSAEKGKIEKPIPRLKPDTGKKSKIVASKSSPALQSSSESTEPKSSSSDELHRKKSPEIESSSEAKEFSKSEKDRKSWQKSGLLRYMQLSTMSSKDAVIAEEEEDRSSRLTGQDPELMETKDPTPEKMETIIYKGSEGAAENTELSESKPSIESSDQAYGSDVEGSLKKREQSFEFSEFERSVGKSKREQKLSSSPPLDEKPSSSAPKAATSRPKKKARSDKIPGKTRRTRHDSGGTVPKSVSLVNIEQSESTSTPDPSDYTPSDDEKETAL